MERITVFLIKLTVSNIFDFIFDKTRDLLKFPKFQMTEVKRLLNLHLDGFHQPYTV